MEKYDFCGWATRNNVKCSDGRVIMPDAFKHNDGTTVPLVWNHGHAEPFNVLGHAKLENRPEGIYTYGYFNDSESARAIKTAVQHGDITSLSIYANHLKHNLTNVVHGSIKEVSLVLAGANPGAFIEDVILHGDDEDGSAYIFTGELLSLQHSENEEGSKMKNGDPNAKPDSEKTVQDVFDTLNEEQKTVVYALIGQALSNDDDNEGDENMKHNAFENDNGNDSLSHADTQAVFTDIKRYGSLKESAIAHGIEEIGYLFPDAQNVDATPTFIRRDNGWVGKVMTSVHRTPFSRIKSIHADITADDARAKGYIKSNMKLEEVFTLLKRTTTPTTIYKKQKLDRDDVVDITDFDAVGFVKLEMRDMLDEELARAILISDGRPGSSNDKISELNIRPVWKDDDLYTIKTPVVVSPTATTDEKAKAFIRAAVKSRKEYKGSGQPTLFTTEDVLTDCLLMEDKQGRVIYDTIDKLKAALRVVDIVTVPVMEEQTRTDTDGKERTLQGLILNLKDYNVGADKGGAVNMFDDFDIDYNAQKYLIETRCSGALTKPYSAIALELIESEAAVG